MDMILGALFPKGTLGYCHDNGRFEVNGLEVGTIPEHCDIIARGQDRWDKNGRREWFVVRGRGDIEGCAAFFRICTAMEGSGYAEFATGRYVCSPNRVAMVEFVDASMEAFNAYTSES